MSLEVLPQKIYMETLADELGLSEQKKAKAFQTLLEYSESDDLNFYFDQDVIGKKSDEEILQHHIDDPNLYLTDGELSVKKGSKCIGCIDVKLIDGGESLCVGVLSFSQNGTHYYVVYQGDPFPLYYSDIYVLRDEYLDFRTRMKPYKPKKQSDDLNNDAIESLTVASDPSEIPSYLDPESEFYAKELDLAIQLHNAIHIEKYGNQQLNREQRVSLWLNSNAEKQDPSEAKIKRLSSIIAIQTKKPPNPDSPLCLGGSDPSLTLK